MVQSQREIVLAFMEQYPELAQKASELQHGLTLAGRTGGKKKCTKPATMPFSKLKGERPNGNSSFDIGICVSRCTEGGRAPGFRGRILRVTGTSRVGGLQVGTLYQEDPRSLTHRASPRQIGFGGLGSFHPLSFGVLTPAFIATGNAPLTPPIGLPRAEFGIRSPLRQPALGSTGPSLRCLVFNRKFLLACNSARSKLIKRAIATSDIGVCGGTLSQSCRHTVQNSFDSHMQRLRVAGYLDNLLSSIGDGDFIGPKSVGIT
ncbi:hypothetical protein HPB50_021743 [Hyalomma asiaticum]|uniref:Uncharacterized protein n=1 Tax=Hyalomma asiaticum TaxID=266040 RepID=A0ACB7T4F4_HYAAI|nr:hypothetical protein HPB50_021743 [Hyalomma asiaticum]